MTILSGFAAFMLATKTHKLTGPRDLLNEAVKYNTFMIREMLRGRDGDGADVKIVRGGRDIKDTLQFSTNGSFSFYNPHGEMSPKDTDHETDISLGWRFAKVDFGWSDEVITLNSDADEEDRFLDLKHAKMQQARTEMMNGMEDALFAVPVYATMEQGTGQLPVAFSIPAFINEATNGVWPGWTLKETVDPANEPRWRPQQVSYDSATPEDEDDGLIASFDDMWMRTRFEPPEDGSTYFEQLDVRRQKILTNRNGSKLYKRMLRALNDQTRQGPQDPNYNNPVYSGIPVKYIGALDSAPLEITGGTVATGNAWPATKPRFIWANLKYLFTIYHNRGYMEQVGPKDGGIRQPFSAAVFFRTWYNLFARSLQRQGIVYPG